MDVRLRVSVVGLFVDGDAVLLLHQMTGPEPDCWDLPGGGLEPAEALLKGLAREVEEETGITDFQVECLITLVEGFYTKTSGEHLHVLSIVYRCTVPTRPAKLVSSDPKEVGAKGIQWLPIAQLTPENCSTRAWKALVAANLID